MDQNLKIQTRTRKQNPFSSLETETMPLLSNEYLQAEFSYLRSQFPNRKISPFLFFGILTNSLWALNSTLDTYGK